MSDFNTFHGDFTKQLDQEHVIHSWSVNYQADRIVVERAEGIYFWDSTGNRYIDFSSGLVNINLGHQHPRVVEAIKNQADQLCYTPPVFANSTRAQAAAAIAAITPGNLNQVFFTTGGADANENALKFARFFTGRSKVLAKYQSYHGATMGALSLTGDNRRHPAGPGLGGVIHFPDPFDFRPPHGVNPEELAAHAADHLKYLIEWEGPDSIAAVFLEAMAGSGGGYHTYPAGYLERVRQICDQNEILLVIDEVMVGFGRTGKWFAIQHTDVVPDMMTMAKGLTSGYVPLGALAVSDRIMDKLGREKLWTGLTYNGHPLGCAAALAAIETYRVENLIENAAKMGKIMQNRLEEMKNIYPIIGDARSIGLFGCIELVQNRESKTPLRKDLQDLLKPALMEKGLSTLVKEHIIFTGPPLIVNADQIHEGLDIIERVIREVQKQF